jgi:hypothetical protein
MRSNGIHASETLTWEKLVAQELDLVNSLLTTHNAAAA